MPTVLVVDDSLDILSALSEALTGEGWAVVAAVSTAAAIYAAQAREIDVVLCDVGANKGTGDRSLQVEFEHRGIRRIPFTFMTTSPQGTAKPYGGPVLRKPFSISEVVGVLAAAVSNQGGRTAGP